MAREMYLVHVKEEELLPPAPPEQPKTPKGKWENYWYHYKWLTIGIAAGVAVLSVLIYQMITKPRPDYNIMLLTEAPVLSETEALLEQELSKFGRDINGNGKVEVNIDTLYFQNSFDSQMVYANNQKFIAMLSTGDAMLFAFEPDTYKNKLQPVLDENKDFKFFDTLNVTANGLNDHKNMWNWKDSAVQKKDIFKDTLPKDLLWGVRAASGTADNKGGIARHDECKELLEAFINNKPLTQPPASK